MICELLKTIETEHLLILACVSKISVSVKRRAIFEKSLEITADSKDRSQNAN